MLLHGVSTAKNAVAATVDKISGNCVFGHTHRAQSNIVLRQAGTGVSAFNEIAAKAKEDLGITMEMTALDSDSVTQRVATQPDSFDIADIEYWICKKVWPTGNLQAMDTSKIANYDKIAGTFRSGKLTPTSEIAQGTAPHTVGFVEGADGKEFVDYESVWMTLIPTICVTQYTTTGGGLVVRLSVNNCSIQVYCTSQLM